MFVLVRALGMQILTNRKREKRDLHGLKDGSSKEPMYFHVLTYSLIAVCSLSSKLTKNGQTRIKFVISRSRPFQPSGHIVQQKELGTTLHKIQLKT